MLLNIFKNEFLELADNTIHLILHVMNLLDKSIQLQMFQYPESLDLNFNKKLLWCLSCRKFSHEYEGTQSEWTLDLSFNDLSIVPTETLVAGISGLEKVNLAGTRLTTEQLIGIFRGLSVLEDHKLKTLELNSYDLSSVPTDILVAGIFGLEKMILAGTWLTTEQLTGIFTGLSVLEDHKLKTLILNKNNLSSVPTQMLVAVISGLEEVYLTQTELTSEQLTGIYRMVADRRCPRLREINLGGNNRSSSISQDLQDRAGLNESVFIYDW